MKKEKDKFELLACNPYKMNGKWYMHIVYKKVKDGEVTYYDMPKCVMPLDTEKCVIERDYDRSWIKVPFVSGLELCPDEDGNSVYTYTTQKKTIRRDELENLLGNSIKITE